MTATGDETTNGEGPVPSTESADPFDGAVSFLDAGDFAERRSRLSSRVSVLGGMLMTGGLVVTILAAPVAGPRPTAQAAAVAPQSAVQQVAEPLQPPPPPVRPCPPAAERFVETTPVAADGSKTVSLTFDDGPGEMTPQVLDILREKKVRGVFFVLGSMAQEFPDHLRRIAAEGHQLGNHTHRHVNLRPLSQARQEAELDTAAVAVEGITGRKMCVFRPPYGSFDETTVAVARARNMSTVMWTADTVDWAAPSTFSAAARDKILRLAKEGAAHPNPVVLMHDGGGDPVNMLAALPLIIDFYRAEGYRFVDMSGESADDVAVVGKPAEQSRPQQNEALPVPAPESARRSTRPWADCLVEPVAGRTTCLRLGS